MSYLLMPADPTLKRLATTIEEERNHALVAKPEAEEREEVERAEAGERFAALSSGAARLDEHITVAPGENLALFGEPEAEVSPHLAAFGGITTTAPGAEAEDPTARFARAEPSYARRERLRAERATLVAALARKTKTTHQAVNGEINRAVGAASVGQATLEQLERANRLLERRLGR